MKLLKKLVSFTLVAAMLFGMSTTFASAATPIKLVIDGKTVTSDVPPTVVSGSTMVPLRVVSETLGADVTWNQSKQQATVKTAAYSVIFTLNSKEFTVNGTTKTLTTAASLVNGRTMIPIRAMAEAIGAEVNYNSATNTATVDYFTKMTGSVKVSGSTTVLPIMQKAADKLLSMNKGLSLTVAGGGSGAGVKDTISGANNVGMSSRALTADETAQLNPFVMANDGIAIIVHPNNAVKNLTKDQAAKIFLGEIKNWKEVGGADAPILIQTRETGSGTLATLSELLLEKKAVASTATPFTSSALLKQAVAKSTNAIGFDSVGFVDKTVKVVTLNNIAPNGDNINSGAYPLSRQLYVFTKGKPSGASARLIDYLRTKTVQETIVSEEGYVPFK